MTTLDFYSCKLYTLYNEYINKIDLSDLPKKFTGIVEYHNRKKWLKEGIAHREDGPAIEYFDGAKIWYFEDKVHRLGGPATEYSAYGEYWIYNNQVTKKEHDLLYSIMKLKGLLK